MAFERHDTRTKAPAKYGKDVVSYPYGLVGYPRITTNRTSKRGLGANIIPDLTPYKDQQSFPNSFKIETKFTDAGDDTDLNLEETFETLPGPVLSEITTHQDTGVPMLISRQKRAATDIFTEGELIIPAFTITSVVPGAVSVVTINVSGQSPKSHMLSPREWVTIAGTGTSLDGNQRILNVLNDSQISFAVNAGGSASSGTCLPMNHVMREVKQTENANVIVKVDSMVAVSDVTVFNEDDVSGHRKSVKCWKDFAFPDCLESIASFGDTGFASSEGSVYSFSSTTGTGWGLGVQHGYHGPCVARRYRFLSMGEGAGTALETAVGNYSPTVITPTSGTVASESVSNSQQASSGGSSMSQSFTWRLGSIPAVLTPKLAGTIGAIGGARIVAFVPKSNPITFNSGDTITLMEQPQKLQCGLWQVFVYVLVVPYTMATNTTTAALSYGAENPSYPHGTAISNNTPTYTGPGIAPTSYSVLPSLPSGLSINGSTGVISGTPSSATANAAYTVTATGGGATAITILNITIT
jgi:Putative Ig domain